MPAKFNLYRAACIINLILVGGYILILNYYFFRDLTIDNDFIYYLLFMAVLVIYAWNNTLGLGMLRRYNNQEGMTSAYSTTVTFLFILQLLLQLIIGYSLGELFFRFGTDILERGDFWLLLIQLIPLIVFLLTVYCEIMTFPLMKAVRRRQTDLLSELDHLGTS